jgi:predicted lipoprotein with Yx(FWY)xxD motif
VKTASSRTLVSVLAGTALTAVALGGCSSSGSTAPTYHLRASSVGGVGTVIVDGQGYTLYLFVPDNHGAPTCTDSCAAAWPPLLLPSGVAAAKAGSGTAPALLGTVRRSDGSVQVTYGGWPLYHWVGDSRPGVATGEGLNNFGGLWYAVSPSGNAVR